MSPSIEFLPTQFFISLLPPTPKIVSRRPESITPLIFPRVPGIEFIELEDHILRPTSHEQRLDLAHTMRFCRFLNTAKARMAPKESDSIPSPNVRQRQVHFYVCGASEGEYNVQTSTIVHLISRWRLLYLSLSPREATAPFDHLPCIYQQQSHRRFGNLFDSLCMIAKGLHGPEPLIEWSDTTELNDSLATNVLTQITKRFFIFAGPIDDSEIATESSTGPSRQTVTELLPVLKALRVSMVVRLNNTPSYDDQLLIRNGIQHLDLSTAATDQNDPLEMATINRFLECCENAKGIVAVHSSLGERAALCVACFLIKHAELNAVEAVEWLRFCRPQAIPNAHLSMVLLEQLQPILWQEGNEYRQRVITGSSGNAAINEDNTSHLMSQISIGKITLGRDALLGKTSIKPSVPIAQQQRKEMAQRIVAVDARRRPVTQGASVANTIHRRRADSQQPSPSHLRSRHSASEASTDHNGSLRADFSVMHKFLHHSGSNTTTKLSGNRINPTTQRLSLRPTTTGPETPNSPDITF